MNASTKANNKKLLGEIIGDYELYRAYTMTIKDGMLNNTIFSADLESELEDLTELLIRRGEYPQQFAKMRFDYNFLTLSLLEYMDADYMVSSEPPSPPPTFNEL